MTPLFLGPFGDFQLNGFSLCRLSFVVLKISVHGITTTIGDFTWRYKITTRTKNSITNGTAKQPIAANVSALDDLELATLLNCVVDGYVFEPLHHTLPHSFPRNVPILLISSLAERAGYFHDLFQLVYVLFQRVN